MDLLPDDAVDAGHAEEAVVVTRRIEGVGRSRWTCVDRRIDRPGVHAERVDGRIARIVVLVTGDAEHRHHEHK